MINGIPSIWQFELTDLNGILPQNKVTAGVLNNSFGWDLGYDVEVSLLKCITQSLTQSLYRCYNRKIKQYLRIFEYDTSNGTILYQQFKKKLTMYQYVIVGQLGKDFSALARLLSISHSSSYYRLFLQILAVRGGPEKKKSGGGCK